MILEVLLTAQIMQAIGKIESNCGKYMVGDDGKSIGYFQVKLSTARTIRPNITRKQLMRDKTNYQIALKYLQQGIAKFDDMDRALVYYNGGPGTAARVRYPRKFKYVKKIHRLIDKGDLCDLSGIQ